MKSGELLQAWNMGDEAAGEQFTHLVDPMLRGYFSWRGNACDVPDLVQKTIVRLLEHRHRFDGSINAWPWVRGIARNILREHLRYQPLLYEDPDEWVSTWTTPSEQLVKQQLLDAMLARFEDLPIEQQHVARLCFEDGLTPAEAAELLDVPGSTIRSRLTRAKRHMRNGANGLDSDISTH